MPRRKAVPPESQSWEPPAPARPDLHGFRAILEDICYQCGGKLRAPDGTFCEAHIDTVRIAFAAAVCKKCRIMLDTYTYEE